MAHRTISTATVRGNRQGRSAPGLTRQYRRPCAVHGLRRRGRQRRAAHEGLGSVGAPLPTDLCSTQHGSHVEALDDTRTTESVRYCAPATGSSTRSITGNVRTATRPAIAGRTRRLRSRSSTSDPVSVPRRSRCWSDGRSSAPGGAQRISCGRRGIVRTVLVDVPWLSRVEGACIASRSWPAASSRSPVRASPNPTTARRRRCS